MQQNVTQVTILICLICYINYDLIAFPLITLEYINNSGISCPAVYHKCAIIMGKIKNFLAGVGFRTDKNDKGVKCGLSHYLIC